MPRKIKILCVEDDEEYLLFLKLMIEQGAHSEFSVDTAITSDDAIQKLAGNAFDVCFVDFRLEGKNTGLDVLRHFEGYKIDTAFVFLTAYAKKEWAFEAMSLGAMDYLTKAKFDQFEFEKTLSYVLFRKMSNEQLRLEATRDHLTGLGNRQLFNEQLQTTFHQAQREDQRFGALYIDLDGFKPVNDTYGHDVGDKLLQGISGRIVESTRKADVVARLGGDEFAVILAKLDSSKDATVQSKKIERKISTAPYIIDGHRITVGASVGTAVFPDDTNNVNDLMRLADKRMYEAKRQRNGIKEHVWY